MNQTILKAIEIAGGTQAKLAKKTGISQVAVCFLLNGRKGRPVTPSLRTAKKLSDATGIPWVNFMESSNEASKTEIKKNNENKELTSMNEARA